MHITIIALGSHGDVLPCATLGRALREAGHKVRLATLQNSEPMVEAHGLDFYPIRGDAQAILAASGGIALAESGQNVIRMWRTVMRSFGALAASYARDLSALALYETDAIVNQLPGALYGYDLAEKNGVPMWMAAVMPLTRTRAFPMLAFPPWLGAFPGYNALTYRVAEQLVWQVYRPAINRWRQETLDLPRWPFWGYLNQLEESSVPVLNAFSPHVVPRPPDWGDRVHVTGYWFPEDPHWQPPDDLIRFIEGGPAPVFIGFGSMPVRDPQRTTAVLLDALAQSGQRGIVHVGWAGIGDSDLPKGVFQIDYAPYGWLFPRMAAVVHHGGSGTTGLGLRAGIPSIVVPFLFDQFYWGRRIAALGVGPRPVPYRRLSAERLAGAIRIAVSDTGIKRRAAVLGERIRAERGLENAVRAIERQGR